MSVFMNRAEFMLKFYAQYRWLRRNNSSLLDKMFPRANNIWTLETCRIEALKYNTRREYQMHSASSYNSAINGGWLDEVCKHMKLKVRWTLEKCKDSAASYESRWVWNQENYGAYCAARKNGWLDEVCKHMKNKAGKNSMRQILCSNGITYESSTYASKELGISRGLICDVLRGRHRQAKGFTFSYVQGEDL